MLNSATRMALALCLAAATAAAHAAEPPALQGLVTLNASATTEVTKDLLTVTLATTREGADAGTVQTQLKQALDAALGEAKKTARPGQVDVQTGNFQVSPRYTNKGVSSGWLGTAELVIAGRDMPAIGQLTGRITTLAISRVAYDLSRELREKVEGEVSAQAIARFRAKAADYAKNFGYTGYSVRDVSVNTNESTPGRPMPMQMQARAVSGASDEALPVEPGKGAVVVSVNGSVQMTR